MTLGSTIKKPLKRTFRFWIYLSTALIAILSLLVAFAFSPGKVEGNYRGFVNYACDCVQFFHFRSNKVVDYTTEGDNTADLFGRYEQQSDGTVKFFMTHVDTTQGESEICIISPRKLCAKFTYVKSGESEWFLKWPFFGSTKRTINNSTVSPQFAVFFAY